MKKIKLKTLILMTTLGIGASTIAPILVSCVNNKNSYEYNKTTKQLQINASSIIQDNIFEFFSQIYLANSTGEITEFEQSINDKISNLLKIEPNSLQLDFATTQLDLKKYLVIIGTKGNNIIQINSDETNKVPVDSIVFKFEHYSDDALNRILSLNRYTIDSKIFDNFTLEQIWNDLTDEELIKYLSLTLVPTNLIILKDPETGKRYGEIVNLDDGRTKNLKLLIFTPQNGLGEIVISSSYIQTDIVEPSSVLLDIFGNEITNEWPKILNTQIPMPNNWVFDSSSIISGKVLNNKFESYDNFLINNNEVADRLKQYNTDSFNKDFYFFAREYMNSVQNDTGIPNIYKNGFYITSNVTVSSDGVLKGKIGLQITNNTPEPKEIKLPINNVLTSIEPNGTTLIVLDFDEKGNSKISPILVPKDVKKNQSFLSTMFDNFSMSVYSISAVSERATNTYSFTQPTKLFSNSYALKTMVENVAFGTNIIDNEELIQLSSNQLNENDLKDIKSQQIQNDFEMTKTLVTSIETIMLKISENVSIYDLLLQIEKPMYEIMLALTNDTLLSSIISGLFSNDLTSDYLHKNLKNIIQYLKLTNTSDDPRFNSIIELIENILLNNETSADFVEWVESIEGLFPTLDKLLDHNLNWIKPLLGQLMKSVSLNKPIITMLFENFDYIAQYLTDTLVTDKIGESNQKLIKSVVDYFNSIVLFSKEPLSRSNFVDAPIISDFDPNKYKTITALDILAFELSNSEYPKSLFNVLESIFQLFDPVTAKTMSDIGNFISNSLEVPKIIQDYSTAPWDNEVSKNIFTGKWSVKKYKWTNQVKRKLQDQLGIIIKAIFNVQVGVDNKPQLLSQVLKNNVEFTTIENTFAYNKDKKTVSQNLTVKFNFKEQVMWDTLSLCVLMDDVKIYLEPKLDNTIATLLPTLTGLKIDNKSDPNRTIIYDLELVLPRDIIVKPDNYIQIQYNSNESSLFPKISNDGFVNWSYVTRESITYDLIEIIKYSNYWDNNINYKNEAEVKQIQYYGADYDKLWNLVYTALKYSTNTKLYSIDTNLAHPVKLDNYNPNIINPNYSGTQLLTNEEINVELINFINNNVNWENTNIKNVTEINIKNNELLKEKIKSFFKFDTNVNFQFDMTGNNLRLGLSILNQTIKILDSFNYSLTVIFDKPILLTKPTGEIELLSWMTFNISMDTEPKPTI